MTSFKIDIVTIAYQIKKYLDKFSVELSKETSRKIRKIVENLINKHKQSSFEHCVTARIISKFKSMKSSLYSQDWTVNKSRLLSNIKKFYKNTVNYRQNEEFVEFFNEFLFSESFWNHIKKHQSVELTENISTLAKSRQHRSHNDVEDINNLRLNRFFKHFRFLSANYLFSLKKQFIVSITKISTHMIKSDQSNNESRDNEEKSWRSMFESNNATEIIVNELLKIQKTTWNEISQQNWLSFQDIIQFMNTINQILQTTLQALQASISTNQSHSLSAIQNTSMLIQQNNKWNAFELEFFDSLYDEKSSSIDNAIEHSDKDIYFRDVHIFIERIKDIAQIKDEISIRNNLYTCLRDTALTWYTFNLRDDQKRLIKLKKNVEEWVKVLFKKFRQSFSTVMITVIRKKYTMNDAKRRKESIEYAQIIIRVVKSAKMSVYNQIYLIYNELNLKFRRDLSISLKFIDMNSFISKLNVKKEIWWELELKNRVEYNQEYFEYQQRQIFHDYSHYQQFSKEQQLYTSRYDDYSDEYRRQ